ncbi:carboxymuconolactone decarboxylase family protein [Burkholderia pseudomallei]|uniref:carboxymuconolactone decarboxylase family protein n=1 Tax=Burkholderia pseudomallei TaxID=28450 RepID=UPI0009772796|nr:carboxymuconolactone decarboxylase family protein [Burkholderia pseudomallei]ONA09470.1 carboxymuconolactone decarboxylase [Burkholderia pseudomallei]CAJ2863244.1 carboxymuconolactone decarboxylase family protein [Burkholderia pseudomallei]VBE88099.1 carboxymuconolactone decarboxylase family protein [Burkholderia pseudomallei]
MEQRISEDRYTRGWNKLKEIDGKVGERVVAALAPIAPDFGRLLVEFGFGDIYSRPQLDLKSREIATLGHAQPQLKVHIEAALNVGCTRDEIVEVFMQMALYAGFPAALNALFAAHDVFGQRDAAHA